MIYKRWILLLDFRNFFFYLYKRALFSTHDSSRLLISHPSSLPLRSPLLLALVPLLSDFLLSLLLVRRRRRPFALQLSLLQPLLALPEQVLGALCDILDRTRDVLDRPLNRADHKLLDRVHFARGLRSWLLGFDFVARRCHAAASLVRAVELGLGHGRSNLHRSFVWGWLCRPGGGQGVHVEVGAEGGQSKEPGLTEREKTGHKEGDLKRSWHEGGEEECYRWEDVCHDLHSLG